MQKRLKSIFRLILGCDMRLILLSILSVFLLSGCVSKKVLVKQDLVNEQALIHSKSVQIKDGTKAVVYIVATYLNEIKSKYISNSTNEQFLVGLYQPEKSALNANVEFVINDDANNTIVQKLQHDDKLLKLIPSYSSWNSYYLVEIKSQNTRTLKLEFITKEYKKTGINFKKNYL